MKLLFNYKLLLFAGVLCLFISCKKNTVEPAFTATINNQAYSFDSLFAWIDTSSASSNYYFINVGAKDTKGGNFVYLTGEAYGDKNYTGTYYFVSSPPYPLPATFKWINGVSVVLNTGQDKGIFHLGGTNISNLSIDKITGSTLQGNFFIVLNPVLSNGTVDFSQSLQMTGQFNVPYYYIP
jgi:hypothetical protein